MRLRLSLTIAALLMGAMSVPSHAALVLRTDTDGTEWLIQTSESTGSQSFQGNDVTSSVSRTGTWSRGVVGQPAYGFIQYSVGGAGAATPATATGTWAFTNLAAGQYDVATTFRANGASNVRHTVNGVEFFVDQSAQPGALEGPSFTTNYIGDRAHAYNFVTLDTVTVAQGGSITVIIDNSNNTATLAMDSVGLTLVPEPSSALLGVLGLLLVLRRQR